MLKNMRFPVGPSSETVSPQWIFMRSSITKFLKYLLWGIIGLIVLFVVGVALFLNLAPQVGQPPKGEDLRRMGQSPHYADDQFVNQIETHSASFGEAMQTLPDFIWNENGTPESPLPVKFDPSTAPAVDSLCYITWYGHSAFLIEMAGLRILIDPMFGESAAPVSFGASRFPYQRPIPIEELTEIDALILSHDHYDHLDYPSIMALKDEVGHFYTALGVGSHLKHWGIPTEQITEFDWGESAILPGLQLVACPARHFSGRAITDNNATLWASWALLGQHQRLYFSGDGGYGPHFAEIGEQYGPFDLAMLECGQYNQAWKDIHMMPEQSVQAGLDLRSKLLMPIHWGAFELSVHTWTDPIERFQAESQRLQAPMVHPFIGERFCLGQDYPRESWWEQVEP
jgi:L-ascorbate metabolism protein UlaG (beta-lactamase superfamily)